MQECIDAILLAVPTVGAVSTYEEIHASIPVQFQSQLPNAFKSLKQTGQVRKFIDGNVIPSVHVVERMAL